MWPSLLKIFRMTNPENYSAKYIFVKIGNIVTCVWTWLVSVIKDYPNNNPFGSTSDLYWVSQTVWEYSDVYDL